jgi:high affinity Mn2+ porin
MICAKMKKIHLIIFFLIYSFSGFSQNSKDTTNANWTLHFQFSTISQWHGNYSFPYAGPSSLDSNREYALSMTSTLFIGRRLWKNGAFYINPEITGGSGLSLTHGAAGFPNGEIYRVGNPTPTPFLARAYIEQYFALGSSPYESVEDGDNQLQGNIPSSRITLRVGKFCLADFFDANSYDHDARTQFLNWSLMQEGAWDFPADTRGYTSGLEIEWNKPGFALRYALVQVSKIANALDMDWDLLKYNGQTLEFESNYKILPTPGIIRFTSYMNTTRAPDYSTAVGQLQMGDSSLIPVLAGTQLGPDVPSIKYGFSLNVEQYLGRSIGAFFRVGWNNGKTASWEFTDIDRSLQLGINVNGRIWKRPLDNFGLAIVINGISKGHQDYLKAGGWTFIIGDGKLNPGLEQIMETYYRASINSFLALSVDYQLIINPAYNRDRKGPVSVPGIRVHIAI